MATPVIGNLEPNGLKGVQKELQVTIQQPQIYIGPEVRESTNLELDFSYAVNMYQRSAVQGILTFGYL